MTEAFYRDYDHAAFEWQYNVRVQVPEGQALIDRLAAESAAYRERANAVLDRRYGDGRRQLVDLFVPARVPAPVLLFVHGGYWISREKSIFSFMAEALVDAGALVAVAGYDLCPQVTLDRIVEELREAAAWLHRNVASHGGDPARIHVAGHSAGGHLAAMLAATDWSAVGTDLPADLVASATPVSGIFDLEPIRLHSVTQDVRLDPEAVVRNSPIGFDAPAMPVTVCVGGAESDEFRRQSRILVDAWSRANPGVEYLEIPDRDHFTVLEDLGDRDYLLTRLLLDRLGL